MLSIIALHDSVLVLAAPTAGSYTRSMVSVIVALSVSVGLALVYSALVERVDEASVHRRQLDAWVAIGAFGCWLVLAGNDLSVRRDMAIIRSDIDDADARPTQIVRHVFPDLGSSPIDRDQGEDRSTTDPALDAPSAMAQGDAAFAVLEPAPSSETDRERRSDASPPKESALQAVSASSPEIRLVIEEGAAVVVVLTEPAPGRTPRLVVIVTPTPTPSPLPITPLVPTSVPPTPDVRALPSATPHCGSADEIDFTVRIERAEADRGPDGLKVNYRARIENRSAFPVTMTDISITAQNSASGSEHYGHALRADISLSPFDRVTIEGSIPLTKSPSPFGRTDLCFSMVGETCGERDPYDMLRRCSAVDGF